jgi:hypothetical protein
MSEKILKESSHWRPLARNRHFFPFALLKELSRSSAALLVWLAMTHGQKLTAEVLGKQDLASKAANLPD